MIVADTHAWIWWISQPHLLSPSAARAMADGFGVAAISTWEVALLAEKRRIALDQDSLQWLRHATALPRIHLLELTVDIAARAASYPREIGGDPADRLIVATTVEHDAKLVTKDRRIRASGLVPTIW